MTDTVSVVLAGGGTAGHVEPALALADELRRELGAAVRITALGTERGLEARLVPQRGYELALIPRVPLPRRLTPELATVPARQLAAVRATGAVLRNAAADVVVGFGGYVALPAYLAARWPRLSGAGRPVPVVVHEANALPGLANRIGARLTRFVAVSVPSTPLPHATVTGLPVRSAIVALDRSPAAVAAARAAFGLDPQRRTLLAFGGSQGARRINDALVAAAPELVDAGFQVLHAAGAANLDSVRAALPPEVAPHYRVLGFVDDMAAAYLAADLAVARAGAMSCAELAAAGVPAIYVPLPIGNGEQRRNAEPIVAAGGGVLVADADLTAARLVSQVRALLRDPDQLVTMSRAARSRAGGADAARRLAELTLAAAGYRPDAAPSAANR